MNNLVSLALALAMVLFLPAVAFAFDYDHGGSEGNYLDVEQHGAYNTVGVEQDLGSYGSNNTFGYDGDHHGLSNRAEISQCGLLNSAYVYQRATKTSCSIDIKQVGFANKFCIYQQ